jgi:hypothetical protein
MLSYEVETAKTLLVSGDRATYEAHIVPLGGIWSIEKSGWIVPRRSQTALNQLIISLGEKRHKKFHREVSDDEIEPTSTSSSSNLIKFYKKLQKTPRYNKTPEASDNESDGVYSSSDDSSSSSNGSDDDDNDQLDTEIKHLKDVVYDIGARIKTLETISKRR